MDNKCFEVVLLGAIAGKHGDIETILKLYEPLMRKYATINGRYNEDLFQYLMIHVALKIHKFNP